MGCLRISKKSEIQFKFNIQTVLDILTRYSILPNTVIADSNKNDSRFYGLVSLEKKEIYLQRGSSTKMKIETLIHELIHIIKHEAGIKDTEQDTLENEREIYKLLFGEEPRRHE